VLAVLPPTDLSETQAESLSYCSLLRSPLGSAFAGASKLSFWPEQSGKTALSKAAQDFSDSQNVVGVPPGARVALFTTELAKPNADPSSAELWLDLSADAPPAELSKEQYREQIDGVTIEYHTASRAFRGSRGRNERFAPASTIFLFR
jgi:hypothetical protein